MTPHSGGTRESAKTKHRGGGWEGDIDPARRLERLRVLEKSMEDVQQDIRALDALTQLQGKRLDELEKWRSELGWAARAARIDKLEEQIREVNDGLGGNQENLMHNYVEMRTRVEKLEEQVRQLTDMLYEIQGQLSSHSHDDLYTRHDE